MVDKATADVLGIEASTNVFAAGSIVPIVAGTFVRCPKNRKVCALFGSRQFCQDDLADRWAVWG